MRFQRSRKAGPNHNIDFDEEAKETNKCKKCTKKINEILEGQDSFGVTHSPFTIMGFETTGTFFGGLNTLCLYLLVLMLAIVKITAMVTKTE